MSDFCKREFLHPEMWYANAYHVQSEPDGDESRFMSTAIRFDGGRAGLGRTPSDGPRTDGRARERRLGAAAAELEEQPDWFLQCQQALLIGGFATTQY